MKLVIDASVAVKWVLAGAPDEADVDAAIAILKGIEDGQHSLVQPSLWFGEVLAVVVRRSPLLANSALADLRKTGAQIVDDDPVYLRAAELSHRLNHHLFDTLYHAVALEKNATLVTADERYFSVAVKEGAIQRLSNFALPQDQSN